MCHSIYRWIVSLVAYLYLRCFFVMIRRPPRSTQSGSSAASDVYKRQAYCRMTGYTHHELAKMNIRDIDFPDSPDEVASRTEEVIKKRSGFVDMRQRRKDGSFFDAVVSSTFLNVSGGILVSVCRDITIIKENQAERSLIFGLLLRGNQPGDERRFMTDAVELLKKWSGCEAAGIRVNAFKPANSRFLVDWSKIFRDKFAGTPVKNVGLTYAGHRVRGELMISQEGIEGGAIYALSKGLREKPGHPLIIDFRPDLTVEALAQRLTRPRGKDSQSNYLRKVAGLSPVAINLLRETGTAPDAAGIKAMPLKLLRPAGISRAISSAGGIDRNELDANFQLKKIPGCYAVGEMLDWEAPTGGYLLTACFASGRRAGRGVLGWLGSPGNN